MSSFFFFSLLVNSSWLKTWRPNDRRWTCHRQKWPLDPGGHSVTARVKECTSFLRLCFSRHGPLANPVALRLEGADNPNITQTCAHCFCDTALRIQSVPPLSKNKQDWFLLTCRTLGLYISLLFSISFSPCLCHFQFPSLCLSSYVSFNILYLQMCYAYIS